MVLEKYIMEPMIEVSRERRTSSPIGIPNAKVSSLSGSHQNTIETLDESPVSAYSLPATSASLPARPYGIAATGYTRDDISHQLQDLSPDSFERLPEGSPAFSLVYDQLAQMREEQQVSNEENQAPKLTTSDTPFKENSPIDDNKQSSSESSRRSKKEIKNLTFALENLHVREIPSSFRPRAASASTQRKLHRRPELPSSTHSTPALRRRHKGTKPNQDSRIIVNLIPKYKFLTETVSVSHEDLVKQQHQEDIQQNGLPSPKSIFSALNDGDAFH